MALEFTRLDPQQDGVRRKIGWAGGVKILMESRVATSVAGQIPLHCRGGLEVGQGFSECRSGKYRKTSDQWLESDQQELLQ